MIWGAIIGDIAGSVWEFDNSMKSRPKRLIMRSSSYTDDTVMTVAVADALLHHKPIADTLREWGNRHKFPTGGYGGRFARWLADPTMPSYGSYGNGSAMRVSAAGWIAQSLDEALDLAEKTAEVTHNHPEGIKGAQETAGAIYLARTGHSKEEIMDFVAGFGYDLNRTCDQIRPSYYFNETCQGTVPEAIIAFLESDSFEDCIKLGISLGGDSDTLCAIAGSVAEAFYGIPDRFILQASEKLSVDILALVNEFESEVVCNETSNS